MADEPTAFGIVQYVGAAALTILTAAIGGLHRRINREGDMLRDEIREAEKRSSDSRAELRHELEERIDRNRNEGAEALRGIGQQIEGIRTRIDQTVTKQDLRDLMAVLRPPHKGA